MAIPRRNLAAISVLMALIVAALPFGGYVTARQDDETYKTTLTEQDIRITGPNFALDDVALEEYPHGQGERVYVSSTNTRSFAEIAFFDDTDSPEQTIDVMMADFESTSQQFEIITSGNADGVFYSLASFRLTAELSGNFYIEVAQDVSGNIDLVQSLYVLNDDFGKQLAFASEEVSIGGNAFLGVTAIDVAAVIADHEAISASTPVATPGPTEYAFKWTDSTVNVQPPLSLDWDATSGVLESVFISSDVSFAYVGYMRLPESSPESALDAVLEGTPAGESPPVLLHTAGDSERITAVYRIASDSGFTILVIELHATDEELWQVEALAGPEAEIVSEVEIFQKAVTIDGTGFLDQVSADELETILSNNQP